MKMKSYSAWRIFSIFFLLLTNFAVQMRSERSVSIRTGPYDFVTWTTSDKYAVASTFESNLMRLMNNLAQNTSQTGFNTSSYGQNPNEVYGLLQCRGNGSQTQCRQCAQNVTRYVITGSSERCNQSISCQILLDSCYVRYANYSFISIFEKDALGFADFGSNSRNSTSPVVFANTLENLFSSLSAEASLDGNKGFAAQSANYSTPSPQKIDAFAECSRDLSSANCSACLEFGFQLMRPIKYLQARFYHPSCLVRYVSTELDSVSTQPGNSASKQLLIMWGLIGGLLLSIFAPTCA